MSKTWLLATTSGDPNFVKGDTDLVWENGKPVDLTDPVAILDQRTRKISQTPLGKLVFNTNLGFPRNQFLGRKNFGEDTAKQVAIATEDMVKAMITSQTDVSQRVPLDPDELISSMESLQIGSVDDEIDVTVKLKTQGGTVVAVNISGGLNGVS